MLELMPSIAGRLRWHARMSSAGAVAVNLKTLPDCHDLLGRDCCHDSISNLVLDLNW